MEIDYASVKMIEIDQAVFTVREVPSWARPIMDFLVDGQVPADENEAHRVTRRSKGYTIINKEIYKPPVCCRDVLNLLKAWRCSGKFIRGSVVTTLHPEH
jgi:transcription antitermination factor NusG